MKLSLRYRGIFMLTPFVVIPGCHDPVNNLDTDGAFIRQPGEFDRAAKIGSGPLLPPIRGASLDMAVVSIDAKGVQRPIREQVITSGVAKAGEQTRLTLETHQNGKITRKEAYLSDAEGLKMTAAGLGDGVSLRPPLPLVRYPVREGDVVSWSGVLKFRGASAPGTASSRISGQEIAPGGGEKMEAYRVDTIIQTTIQGRQTPFFTTRWLAPGVGIVHQRNYGSEVWTERTLIRHRIP
jgi:hypothetical protein